MKPSAGDAALYQSKTQHPICTAACAQTERKFDALSRLAYLVLALVLATTPALDARADTIFGVYVGGGVWSQDVEGTAVSSTGVALVDTAANTLDLEDDLGFSNENNRYFYVGLEHAIPVVPNIRVDYSEIAQSATGQLNRSLSFNGQTFDFSSNITSDIDLEQTDLLLYYEVLDSVVSLDLGIGVRYVDGFVEVADDAGLSAAEFDGLIPLVYAGGRADLPLTGFSVAAQARGLSYKGEQLIDAEARIGWESDLGLGIEVGYRVLNLEVDELDEIDAADLRFQGPFAGLNFSF